LIILLLILSFFVNTFLFLFFTSYLNLSSVKLLKAREQEGESFFLTFFEKKSLYLFSLLLLSIISFFVNILSYLKTTFFFFSNKYFASALYIPLIFLQLTICHLISARFTEQIFKKSLKFLMFFLFPVFLFSYPLNFLANKIKGEEKNDEETREEEKEAFIDEGTREGIFETEEMELIKGIMEFSETIVREVMTPRIDIVSVEASTPLKDAVKIFAESRHTRLPVYESQIDNVIGAIFIKDVLNPAMGEKSHFPVRDFVRPVPFVPENKRISQLLREFQLNKEQLAIVVDEYGGVDGLVTTEDLLEEIVGEIEESGEKEEKLINAIDEQTCEVRGRTSLKDLKEFLDCEIPEGDYDSVAGWIATKLGSLPQSGNSIEIDNLLVKIISADKKRIHKVLIKKISGGNNGKSDS